MPNPACSLNVLCRSTGRSYDVRTRLWFRHALEHEEGWTDPYADPVTGEAMVSYVRCIRKPGVSQGDWTTAGVVVVGSVLNRHGDGKFRSDCWSTNSHVLDPVIENVASYLELTHVVMMGRSCRLWQSIVMRDKIWVALALQRWPQTALYSAEEILAATAESAKPDRFHRMFHRIFHRMYHRMSHTGSLQPCIGTLPQAPASLVASKSYGSRGSSASSRLMLHVPCCSSGMAMLHMATRRSR